MRQSIFLGLGILSVSIVLACALRVAGAQAPSADQPNRSQSRNGFSLATDDDARYLQGLQKAARDACAQVLEAHARRDPWDDTAARRAADTLWTLFVKDRRSLRAMCSNIELRDTTTKGIGALEAFDMAPALIDLGANSNSAIEAVLESLDRSLSRRGVLLRAHVLQHMDERELILIHVRLALDRAKRNVGPAQEIHVKNLAQVEQWLKNPAVLNAVENWPSQN